MTSNPLDAGQDSFLDIIANLVGIFIILIVVVGAQAGSVWNVEAVDSEAQVELEELEENLQIATAHAERLQFDRWLMEQQIDQEVAIGKALEQQRHHLLVQQEIVKREIAERASRLDEAQRAEFERRSRVNELESQLSRVQQASHSVVIDNSARQEVIEHYPTPLAKTVFSDEIHFRLKQGRIVFVPMDELVGQMKREWKVKAEKLPPSSETLETVGPVGGFRLQYALSSKTITRNSQYGPLRGEQIQFKGFMLLPQTNLTEESVNAALQPGARFLNRLKERIPSKTTISIWVYPDSYSELGELKRWSREHGFQVAVWPLDSGSMISGGPNGFRSSAQ